MSENIDSVSFGKKVFFLHPSVVVQNRVIPELAQEEFEVYLVKDEVKLHQILKKYPDSIVFVCISEGMKESACEKWILETMEDSSISNVSIGVVALAENASDREKYTGQIKVKCGYTVVKSDIAHFTKQVADILNSEEAKGRRKYIRLLTERDAHTTVNFPIHGNFVNGRVKDVSVVGFSCSFDEDLELAKNSLYTDVQIRLHSHLINAEVIAFGSRVDEQEKTYVMLFTKRVDSNSRSKIRTFIHSVLQAQMDNELK